MSLKNVLIIVDNIDESIDFYEELFGLRDVYKRQVLEHAFRDLELKGLKLNPAKQKFFPDDPIMNPI